MFIHVDEGFFVSFFKRKSPDWRRLDENGKGEGFARLCPKYLRVRFPNILGHSLKQTASLALKIGPASKRTYHIPTINFQGRAVSFRDWPLHFGDDYLESNKNDQSLTEFA